MNFSVDDLVSSFNASHIGQEARDLALLQAQLAETLFAANPHQHAPPHAAHPSSPRLAATRPSATPLARSPSLASPTFSGPFWAAPIPPPAQPQMQPPDIDDAMDEDMDERMVEELLLTDDAGPPTYNSSPATTNPQSASLSCITHTSIHSPSSPASPLSSSLFTTTDPFYLAQAQTAQAAHNAAARNFGALYTATGGGVFGGYPTSHSAYPQNAAYTQGSSAPGVSPAGPGPMNGLPWGEAYNFKCAAAF